MNKIIKHGDLKRDAPDLVTDIDARFGSVQEPLAAGHTEQTDGKDQASHAEPKRPLRLTLTMAEIKHIYNEEVEKTVGEEPQKVGLLAKVCSFMTMPVELVSMAIIPNVDDEKITAWYMPILPVTSVLAFVTITKRRCHFLQAGRSSFQTPSSGSPCWLLASAPP